MVANHEPFAKSILVRLRAPNPIIRAMEAAIELATAISAMKVISMACLAGNVNAICGSL